MTDHKDSFVDADLPIEDRDSDRLGRRTFAESIAQHILDVSIEHGFTVAVTGEWGSGKTSVLNMVAETLEERGEAVAVLSFNPWLFGGSTELVSRFFNELSAQLGKGNLGQLKVVAKVLTDMGKALAQHSSIPGASPTAAVAGVVVDKWTETPSLLSQRDRLRRTLQTLKSRIVVIIDDIDRLERNETRELIRLIRLTSDLPNVVFLLAFDRRHVASSLGETESDGQQYLEKIVQVSYNLPVVREPVLPAMYFARLDELVLKRDLERPAREVWGRVFPEIVRPLLSNLRNVKRFLYSLPVTLDMVGKEVELADLLGLEAIRILRPALFEELKAHPDCLVLYKSDWRLAAGLGDRKKEIQNELKGMLERAGDDRDMLESVFELLFPSTHEHIGLRTYGTHEEANWRRDRRVACEEVLRIYLSGGIDETAIPSDDIRDLVSVMTDRTQVASHLESLDEQGLEQTLERLEDFEGEFSEHAASAVVPILVNRMGTLSDEFTGSLSFPPRFKANRVIYRLLRRIQDQDALGDQVRNMLNEVNSLSGKLCLVEMVGHRENVGHRLASCEVAKELEIELLESLTSSTTDQLESEWDLIGLSLRPVRWFQDERKSRLEQKFSEHLTADRFVLALLRSAAGYAYRSGGARQKRLPWESLVESFGEELAEAVDRLAKSALYPDLPEEDKHTVQLAQVYAEGGAATEWESVP